MIELPVELFNYLVKIKKTHRGGISHFMSDVIKNRLIIHDLDTEDVLKDEMLVDWYLHPELVEFVPKDEARYKVLITGYSINGNQFVNMDIDDGDILFINEELAITYSKSEADKVIERLGGENGFLQLRKVKV